MSEYHIIIHPVNDTLVFLWPHNLLPCVLIRVNISVLLQNKIQKARFAQSIYVYGFLLQMLQYLHYFLITPHIMLMSINKFN